MNAELEKWIDKNEALAGEFSSGLSVVPSYKLTALFDGKVLVPVDALDSVMELAGVALVYQPFGTKDRQHFDTLLAASQEQGK
jgi:hypothetical protein